LAGKAGNTGGGCAPSPAPHELVRKGRYVTILGGRG
jgi:hypothetical protein